MTGFHVNYLGTLPEGWDVMRSRPNNPSECLPMKPDLMIAARPGAEDVRRCLIAKSG